MSLGSMWASWLNIFSAGTRGAILVLGQSNATNIAPGVPYFQSRPGIWQLTATGQIIPAYEPLQNGGWTGTCSFMLPLADIVLRRKSGQIVLAPIAVGGSTAAQWARGGMLNIRIITAIQQLGLESIPLTAVIWMQGESDGLLNTPPNEYVTSVLSVVQTVRAFGISAPFLVPQETYANGVTSPLIRAAQRSLVGQNGVVGGPDFDLLGAGYRQADNLHFNKAGMMQVANEWSLFL